MTHDEAIKLIQAQKGGKTIEYYTSAMSDTKWLPVGGLKVLLKDMYHDCLLRIKPEPVIVRGWVNVVKVKETGDIEIGAHCYLSKRIARAATHYNYDIIDTIEITYEVKQ